MATPASAAAASSAGGGDVAAAMERLSITPSAAAAAVAAPAAAATSTAAAGPRAALTDAERNVVLVCFTLMLQQVDKLEKEEAEPLASTVVVDTARLHEYAEVLSHAITKFVVFVSQGEGAGVVPSASEELTQHLVGVSCLLRSMLSAGPDGVPVGPTRRAAIIATHHAVLVGVRPILVQLQAHLLDKASTPLNVALTGKAWDMLEKQLKATPLTNATAVGRAINQQCSVLKDARAELDLVHIATEEEIAEKAAAKDAKDEDDEDDDGEFDDEDDEGDLMIDAGGDDALTAEEFAIVPSVSHLTATAATLVKSLYMYLLKVPIDETVATNVDWLELVLHQVQTIGNRLDDLIGALYSPQDRKAVLEAVEAMCTDLRDIAGSIVRHNTEAKAEWPVKAPAADAAAAPALCASCQTVIDATIALPHDGMADHHAGRVEWLRKCLAQVHEGHRLAETC